MAQNALTVPPPDFAPQFGRNIQVAKPTIAAVNGVAFAGGFLLAQQCDLVVAAEHATFAITEVKVGRGAPWAAPLSWLVPASIALQILLTGDAISAHRAQEVGLVNEVVPAAQLHERTQELAGRIGVGLRGLPARGRAPRDGRACRGAARRRAPCGARSPHRGGGAGGRPGFRGVCAPAGRAGPARPARQGLRRPLR